MKAKDENTVKHSSILQKIVYGIVVPLIVILGITGVILNYRITNEVEEMQGNRLQTETDTAIELMEGYFKSYFSMLETMAALPVVQSVLQESSQKGGFFKESPYYGEIIEMLIEIQKLDPEAIQSLYIADFTTGQYLRWDERMPEAGWDITTRPYYQLVNEAQRTIVTPIFQNVAGVTVVSVSTPVFDSDGGQIIGIVNIDLGLDSLVDSMNDITVGNDGYLILFDSDNDIVSAKAEELVLKNVIEVGFSDDLVRKVVAQEAGNVMFQYQQVSYCGNIDFVDNLEGWCVLGIMPEEEYHGPAAAITTVVIVCFAACILMLTALCMMVGRRIIQPVKELSWVVGELAKGNLDVACTLSGDDELGYLAEGVRSLVDSLQTYILQVDGSYNMMEYLAYTDELTGIGNRMAFSEKLKEYEQTENIACVVADVNNLKLCNDKYGHSEGDKVIRDAAEIICKAFKGMGSCYRIGGDEFCILIPGAGKKEIHNALERVDVLVKEKNQERELPLSVAFGYAVREGLDESAEELFKRSDAMMYRKKCRMKQNNYGEKKPEQPSDKR